MILVTGATGNVGRPLVARLTAEGHEVRGLTRNPDRARLPDGATPVAADDLGAALDGASAVFLNPAAFWHGPGDLLQLAAERGVKRMVTLSSSSVVQAIPTVDPHNPIAEHHRSLENAVETAAAAAGMEWTHLRPGMFATNTLAWAEGVRRDGVVRAAHPRAHATPIHEDDIAAVAALALTGALGGSGATPVLTGPESLTQAEQLRLIAEATGRSLRFEEIPQEEARAGMVADGIPAGIADVLLDMAARSVDTPAEVSPGVEELTGRPARTFAQWARDHAADFR
ncbi:NAD(P)H-binding protein [Streptomyces spirodelae]|uniref:NAD(P)H-binding protein n=1 Tax=Streptomyces spirodelae TaxID=2812904 RepID=A0ABS3WUI1_9ACTN|nr:NAD(P)H-binding protein [Streptomyces spirodelae]MBO8186516.1 NAD(P)H-binding protein [Streptomyces spirodelae]